MRAEYDVTVDDLAEAYLRSQTRSQVAKDARRRATCWVAALTGLLLYLFLDLWGASLGQRLIVVTLGAVLAAGGYSLNYHRAMKHLMLKYVREQPLFEAPVRFIVELREDCIWMKQGGTQSFFDWDNLSTVVDSGDAVELCMRDGHFVLVRNKGFPTDESRREFLQIANNRLRHDR